MQYFLVSANRNFDPSQLQNVLGVERVEAISLANIPSSSNALPIHDPTGVLTRNLAIPGPPLTDEEMEILAWDMEHDGSAIPIDQVWKEFEERFANKPTTIK